MATVNIQLDTSFLSVREYARRHGENQKTVENDIKSGLIPTFQLGKGKKHMVNMVALAHMAASQIEANEPWNQPQQITELKK